MTRLFSRCFAWRAVLLLAVPALVVAEDNAAFEEFKIQREGKTLTVAIQSPPRERLAANPLLLIFLSADRASSLPDGRYGGPGRALLEQGHRIASFDLPAHGDRVDAHGGGIAGLASQVAAGLKPFDELVADGRAVIDECVRRGLAVPGRVVLAGVSRGGYCALRLAAGDARIAAVAAFAPVTDWRVVTEFAGLRDRPEVAALALTNFAEALAGRRVYVAIGNHDLRVGTDACAQFILAVAAHERAKAAGKSGLRYHIVDDSPAHTLAPKWRAEGIQFLLREPGSVTGDKMP